MQIEKQPGCIVKDQPACKVILVLNVSLITLSGDVSEDDGIKIKDELMQVMHDCDIMLI